MHIIAALHAPALVAVAVPGGRLGPTIAALVGVAAVVVGWATLRRHDRFSVAPLTVVGTGAATVAAGVVFLLLADGGPGTGNGVVGSSAAIVLGLAAIVLGARARAPARTPGVSVDGRRRRPALRRWVPVRVRVQP